MANMLDKQTIDNHDVLFKSLTLDLFRTFNRVNLWVETCNEVANNSSLSFLDFFILHTIAANDIRKPMSVIGIALGKEDNFNVNYSFKKLIKIGYIEKIKDHNNPKSILYKATAMGIKNIDNYNNIRDRIYKNIVTKDNAKIVTDLLKLLKKVRGMYNTALELISTQKYTIPCSSEQKKL